MLPDAFFSGSLIEAEELVKGAIALAVCIGIFVVVVLESNALGIVTAMGSSPEYAHAAEDFLRVRALSAPAVLLCSVGSGAFRGRLDTRTPLYIAVCANSLNLLLDLALVPQYGAPGSAFATGTAEWVSAAAFLSLLSRANDGEATSAAAAAESSAEVPQSGGALSAFGLTDNVMAQLSELLSAAFPIFLRTALLQAFLTASAAAAARSDGGGAAASGAHQVSRLPVHGFFKARFSFYARR